MLSVFEGPAGRAGVKLLKSAGYESIVRHRANRYWRREFDPIEK